MEILVNEQDDRVGTAACAGCHRRSFTLSVVDDSLLCDACVEKSARIDRQLQSTAADDPVACDGCKVQVDFDARLAVVARECGGKILCDGCKVSFLMGDGAGSYRQRGDA